MLMLEVSFSLCYADVSLMKQLAWMDGLILPVTRFVFIYMFTLRN